MKTFKYILSTVFVMAMLWGCSEDEFGNTDFIEKVTAPVNVSALFQVTQDNTGLVTITPTAEGATSFDVYFGDDTPNPVSVKHGENVQHTYPEGTYQVKLVAKGITGLKTEVTQDLTVSFKAPENLEVVIENDMAVSRQVNVTATADYAMTFDVYFGEAGNDDPVAANIGETASYTYQEAGTYTIRVVAKGGAIATTEYSEDFVVTAIVQPIVSAPTPQVRAAQDVISIFSAAYDDLAATDYFPDWGQGGQGSSWATFNLEGDAMLQYINLSYQGIQFGSAVDVSTMQFLHLDVWTADVARIETSLISLTNGEKPVWSDLTADGWTSIDIPISAFTDQGLTVADIHQLKFVGDPWAGGTVFIDNVYFWKEPAPASGLEGVWKLAPEAGALKVGPSAGSGDWWSSDAQTVMDRACLFDDTFVFGTDGSFKNEMGTETWLETWQGVASEQCGAPVAPHDGSANATFLYNDVANTITITGAGAHLGLPKVNNDGELPNVAVPNSITYNATLTDNNTMEVGIEAGSGVFWTFKLIRDVSPVVGTWKLAPEAGALKVGPSAGNGDWWTSDDQAVIDRACLFDDEYVFSSDGTFSNVLGSDTWLEAWQGVTSDECGTPVGPHDGMGSYTYVYDSSTEKITLNGSGAYLGIPKANNDGELPNVAVPSSVIYDVVLSDNNNTMTVMIEAGSGVFWTFKLVK